MLYGAGNSGLLASVGCSPLESAVPLRMTFSLEVAAKTDPGCVRKKNEDSFGYDTSHSIFVVCDGMGGQAAGEVASHIGVETVLEHFRDSPTAHSDAAPATEDMAVSEELVDAVRAANARILRAAVHTPAQFGMGSTVVAVLVREDRAHIAHVGDSRVYLLRGKEIRQLTQDHSLVMEQVRRGLLTREEAENSRMQNIITRALGTEQTVRVDQQELELAAGDVLLLTSDGLTRHIKDPQILSLIQSGANLQASCDALIEAARRAGGEDNITCLLIQAK
jgi:PPM family protein phosphatase